MILLSARGIIGRWARIGGFPDSVILGLLCFDGDAIWMWAMFARARILTLLYWVAIAIIEANQDIKARLFFLVDLSAFLGLLDHTNISIIIWLNEKDL